MHIVATMGPVDCVTQITVDGKEAWAGNVPDGLITIDAPGLFGGDSDEGGVTGQINFMSGGPAQVFNDYLVEQLDAPVPAFRGVASFVLRQVYMGNNPYLKPWAFRLQRIHVRQDGIAQWYDAKAQIATTGLNGLPGDIIVDDTQIPSSSVGDPGNVGNIHLTGLSATDRMQVTLLGPDGVYPAGSAFPSDSDNGGLTWGCSFSINENDSGTPGTTIGTFINVGGVLYPTEGVAAAALKGQTFSFTGYTSYTMWIPGSPPHPRGGVSGAIEITRSLFDMNPAHVIRECLTDPDWGMGYNEADIDDTTFMACADALYTEGMGMSLLWDTQTDIQDFITTVLQHIDACCFVDRKTGLFVLKLIRNDYVLADQLVLDEDHIDRVEDFKRPQFGELTTSITVQFWDGLTNTQGSVTIQDIALEAMQEAAINTTLQYPGFTNISIATRICQRDLRSLSSQISSCTVYTDRIAKNLQIGSVFRMSWPDYELDDVAMRVTGIAYGDGKTNRIRISCAEDIFSLDATAFILKPPPIWEDPNAPPVPVKDEFAFEYPYYGLVLQASQTAVDNQLSTNPDLGVLGVAAAKPSAGSINAQLYTDAGTGYTDVDTADFCPLALLAGAMDRMQTIVAISDGSEISTVTAGGWCQIGTEICRVDAVSPTSLTLGRACMDTVPTLHSAGDKVFFWSDGAGEDPTQYVSGESINAKLTPKTGSGALELSRATAMNVVMASRANRPYPPGNLKFNGEYFPATVEGDTILTWVHRDRTQETGGVLVDFTDATIGPESGTTYTMKVYNAANTLVRTVAAISGNTHTYTSIQEDTDGGPFDSFRITLAAERGGYESWQIHDVTLAHPVPVKTVGVFLPGTVPPTSDPHMVINTGGKFLVGIRGSVDTHQCIGYYTFDGADPSTAAYIGTTYSTAFSTWLQDIPGDMFVLSQSLNEGMYPQVAGETAKFQIYMARQNDSPVENRILLQGDLSSGDFNRLLTGTALNSDVQYFFPKTDGSVVAISADTVDGPARVWKSINGGTSWSYLGTTTNLPQQSTAGSLFTKGFELSSGKLYSPGKLDADGSGLVWTDHPILDAALGSSDWAVQAGQDIAFDGTTLAFTGQYIPVPAYDAHVQADTPVSVIQARAGGAADLMDLDRALKEAPLGGILGWGWNTVNGLAINQAITGAGSALLPGNLLRAAIGTVGGTYWESRTSTNGPLQLLTGTTDFSLEVWIGAYGTVGTSMDEVVLFSNNCSGRGGQDVLLTWNANTFLLRLRTINAAGAVECDISYATTGVVIVSDLVPHYVAATRNGTTYAIYLDGALVVSGTATKTSLDGGLGCVWGNTTSRVNSQTAAQTSDRTMVIDAMAVYTHDIGSTRVTDHWDTAQSDGITHNYIATSTDGIAWTKTRDVVLNDDVSPLGPGSFIIRWNRILAYGTGFVLYGNEPFSGAFPQVRFSTDAGATWSGSTSVDVVTSDVTQNATPYQFITDGATIWGLADTRKVFDVLQRNGTTQHFPSGAFYPQVVYSTDGITFTDMDPTTFPIGALGQTLILLDDDSTSHRFAETGEVRITED